MVKKSKVPKKKKGSCEKILVPKKSKSPRRILVPKLSDDNWDPGCATTGVIE